MKTTEDLAEWMRRKAAARLQREGREDGSEWLWGDTRLRVLQAPVKGAPWSPRFLNQALASRSSN